MMSAELYSLTYAGGQKLTLAQGDVSQEAVDAIVNAANQELLHGGGVAALIVRAGGRVIQEESAAWVMAKGPVSHDRPAYTSAGSLPAKYVIHAVGPVWGSGQEDQKLAAAVAGSLRTAESLGLRSIAFPAISTGIFGFPKKRAAKVIYTAIEDHCSSQPGSRLTDIRVVVYDESTTEAFIEVWEQVYSA